MTTEQMDIVINELELCKAEISESIDKLISSLKESGVYKMKCVDDETLSRLSVRIAFFTALASGCEKESIHAQAKLLRTLL